MSSPGSREIAAEDAICQASRIVDSRGPCSRLPVDSEHVRGMTMDLEDHHSASLVGVVAVLVDVEFQRASRSPGRRGLVGLRESSIEGSME